jgi:tetratricopeptide (TPR) repeat protein
MARGEWDKVVKVCGEAIRRNPKDAYAYIGRGLAFSQTRQWDAALSSYTDAIRLDPRDGTGLIGRAEAYMWQGNPDKAIGDYEAAIRLEPSRSEPYNDLAWLLATSRVDAVRDGAKAVELATKACELSDWKEAAHIDTLAAAFAEVGKFDEAVKYQKQAVALAGPTSKERAELQQHLELYQQHKPYHGTPEPPSPAAAAGGR